MSTEQTTTDRPTPRIIRQTPAKKRVRREFAAIVKDTTAYCKAALDVLELFRFEDAVLKANCAGQKDALRSVLKRLGSPVDSEF